MIKNPRINTKKSGIKPQEVYPALKQLCCFQNWFMFQTLSQYFIDRQLYRYRDIEIDRQIDVQIDKQIYILDRQIGMQIAGQIDVYIACIDISTQILEEIIFLILAI